MCLGLGSGGGRSGIALGRWLWTVGARGVENCLRICLRLVCRRDLVRKASFVC